MNIYKWGGMFYYLLLNIRLFVLCLVFWRVKNKNTLLDVIALGESSVCFFNYMYKVHLFLFI